MGIFVLWATWAHEYMAIFVKIDRHRTSGLFKSWRYMILIKFGQYINVMMAVAVENFQNF